MPASLPLRAFGLLTALAVVSIALYASPPEPRHDDYSTMVKLTAGILAMAGSLYLAHAIAGTFLRHGGRGAFKALYWASFASAGAGAAEAASAFTPANAPLAAAAAALAFAGAGLTLTLFAGGG